MSNSWKWTHAVRSLIQYWRRITTVTMVFVIEGMNLRIPAGGFVVDRDGASARVELSIDMWPYWVDIAMDQVLLAHSAREQLLAAITDGDGNAKGKALIEECKASMVAISACAFAIEAFYDSVTERTTIQPSLAEAWKTSKPARHARIHQTFARAFLLTNERSKEIRHSLQQIFNFRNQSVHPSAAFTAPTLHPILNVGVERRFCLFRLENAHSVTKHSIAQIRHLVERPRSAKAEMMEWCEGMNRSFVPPLVERWKTTTGLGI